MITKRVCTVTKLYELAMDTICRNCNRRTWLQSVVLKIPTDPTNACFLLYKTCDVGKKFTRYKR